MTSGAVVCAPCVPRFNAAAKSLAVRRESSSHCRVIGSALAAASLVTDALDRHRSITPSTAFVVRRRRNTRAPAWVAFHDERRRGCERSSSCARRRSRMSSDSAGEKENQQNQQDQSETTAWIVPPASAIRPRRQRSEQQQNEEDEQDGCHGNTSLACRMAFGLGRRVLLTEPMLSLAICGRTGRRATHHVRTLRYDTRGVKIC
jgi:hypothetical protein